MTPGASSMANGSEYPYLETPDGLGSSIGGNNLHTTYVNTTIPGSTKIAFSSDTPNTPAPNVSNRNLINQSSIRGRTRDGLTLSSSSTNPTTTTTVVPHTFV